jgi:hypothetical protein
MTKKTKNILAGITALVGIYFVYKYFQKDKGIAQPIIPVPPIPIVVGTGIFPLKKGSKGKAVTDLQNLILKIDAKLLPRFGADGDFGSETEAAVLKLLGKKTVDGQADLNRLRDIFNQKNFPYITPRNGSIGTVPVFDPVGIRTK